MPSQGNFWNLPAFPSVCTAGPRAPSSSRRWALQSPGVVGRWLLGLLIGKRSCSNKRTTKAAWKLVSCPAETVQGEPSSPGRASGPASWKEEMDSKCLAGGSDLQCSGHERMGFQAGCRGRAN